MYDIWISKKSKMNKNKGKRKKEKTYLSIQVMERKTISVTKVWLTNPCQTSTVVNDRIRRNTTIYMVPYYDWTTASSLST